MDAKILNNDKIYEGYKGELGKEFQMKVQKRFLWISQMTHGKSILDVGCSSGIFPILMAREGKRVLGIDIDKSAIEKANTLKQQEEKEIQEKVEFMNVSMNDLETTNKYDTIILAEVLEHVFYPREILKKAVEFLNENGIIIITVPFGINSYFDHKKTYYIWDLFKETSGILEIVDMEFFNEWIGVKCIKTTNPTNPTNTMSLNYLEKMEKTLYNTEHKLHINYSETRKKLEISNKKNMELSNIIKENNENIKKLKKELTDTTELLNKEKENNENIKKLKKELTDTTELLNKEKEKNVLLKTEKEKNMKQIKKLEDTIQQFNQRKIIKILRKVKNVKESILHIK